jgi:E3 ubiquitin-protein ligase DOA10
MEEDDGGDKDESMSNYKSADDNSLNKDLPFCKICWVNDTSFENPLLSSCSCKGGVQFIHYQCLKQWLGTKK